MRCTSIKAWIEPTRGNDWPSSIFLPDFSVYISLLLKHSLFSLSIYCYSGTPFLSTDCDYITGKFFYWINPYILTHINTNNLNSFNNLSLVIIILTSLLALQYKLLYNFIQFVSNRRQLHVVSFVYLLNWWFVLSSSDIQYRIVLACVLTERAFDLTFAIFYIYGHRSISKVSYLDFWPLLGAEFPTHEAKEDLKNKNGAQVSQIKSSLLNFESQRIQRSLIVVVDKLTWNSDRSV